MQINIARFLRHNYIPQRNVICRYTLRAYFAIMRRKLLNNFSSSFVPTCRRRDHYLSVYKVYNILSVCCKIDLVKYNNNIKIYFIYTVRFNRVQCVNSIFSSLTIFKTMKELRFYEENDYFIVFVSVLNQF